MSAQTKSGADIGSVPIALLRLLAELIVEDYEKEIVANPEIPPSPLVSTPEKTE